MEHAIETHNFVKKFGDFTAVNGLDLSIRKGELFGFLGPNGAGKTTTIGMLTTLLSVTSGSAKVAGYDVVSDAAFVRSRIGVVPQSFALFEEMTPMENLYFIGELYGMKRPEIKAKAEELLRVVELSDKADVISSGFSGGMKQRLSVAAGLLHAPEILFMDEPTTGLDPQSRIALRELTKKLNESGTTIVYTTHDMAEADKLCDRIAIMDHGHVIAEGTPQELKDAHGSGHLISIYVDKADAKLVAELKKLTGAHVAVLKNKSIELHVKAVGGGLIYKLSSWLAKHKVVVKELRVSEPSLEEVFINLTRKELRD